MSQQNFLCIQIKVRGRFFYETDWLTWFRLWVLSEARIITLKSLIFQIFSFNPAHRFSACSFIKFNIFFSLYWVNYFFGKWLIFSHKMTFLWKISESVKFFQAKVELIVIIVTNCNLNQVSQSSNKWLTMHEIDRVQNMSIYFLTLYWFQQI